MPTRNTTRSPPSPNRMRSFDILRGISIFLMLVAHIGKYWLQAESQWLVALFYILVNMDGTNGFTFVAGLGFGFSWKRSQARNEPRSRWFRRSLIHTGLLFGVSIGFNAVAALVREGSVWWEYIWYWNILQCIAIARLIGLILIRWRPSVWVRVICAGLVFAFTPFIAEWIRKQDSLAGLAAWVFYVFFNPLYADGILFFLPYFLIGSVLGETLFSYFSFAVTPSKEHEHEHEQENPRKKSLLWIWTAVGVLLVGSSLILGKDPSTLDYGWGLLNTINLHPDLNWVGLPLYLVPNSWVWVLFSLGFEILLTLSIVSLTDFRKQKQKQIQNPKLNQKPNKNPRRTLGPFEIFGRYSLTIYLFHYIGLFSVPWQQALDHRTIWGPLIGFLAIIWLLIYGLHHWARGRYSLEHVMHWGIRQLI